MKYIFFLSALFLGNACFAQTGGHGWLLRMGDVQYSPILRTNTRCEPIYLPNESILIPENIQDSILSIQNLEIIKKRVEIIKRLDSLFNTDNSKSDSTLYRKQQ